MISKFSGNGRVGRKLFKADSGWTNSEYIAESVGAGYNLAGAGLKKQSRADLYLQALSLAHARAV